MIRQTTKVWEGPAGSNVRAKWPQPRVVSGVCACEKTRRQLFDESTAHGFCHRLCAVSHLQEGKQAPHVFLDGAQTPVHLHTDILITQPPGQQTQEFTLNGTQRVRRARRLRRG